MLRLSAAFTKYFNLLWNRMRVGMQAKLLIIILTVTVIPLALLTVIAIRQFIALGDDLTDIAVVDSSVALNNIAVENIERMTTDVAGQVADFLYQRDADIMFLASIEPSAEAYARFIENARGRVVSRGEWALAKDGKSWVQVNSQAAASNPQEGASTNRENEDFDAFHYREPDPVTYVSIPLYDEITFVDLSGNERIKVVAEDTTKKNYPMSKELHNISNRLNTYVKAETYFSVLKGMEPGEIYVSDVIGAYVGSNYIGMYTPGAVSAAAISRGYEIPYTPEEQAYAGKENPNGQRFEGIIRWATPVADENGDVIGYVTIALNHEHIMELVDHVTPMSERYTTLPSAFEGNYAFIWDYMCRSIAHPRHHSIVGYNPNTGKPEVPWLESSIYEAWQDSTVLDWNVFTDNWPWFDEQSRTKTPAPELTKRGLVGLDGRFLNNAPQCTGWMDLTKDGGSGSFYIFWSGLYKLTTAAAIPYYTGQYAPSEANGYSLRGFGFVAIGAGLDDFVNPSTEIEKKLVGTIGESRSDIMRKLIFTAVAFGILVVVMVIMIAAFITGSITNLIRGISRFRAGERQFRFNAPIKDEFGTLSDSFDDMANNITNSVRSPLCITDRDTRVIYMNDEALDICNATLSEIVGRPYHSTSVYPRGTKYDPITALKEKREAEPIFLRESGTYVKGTANYFLDPKGEQIGYIILTNDVTEMIKERTKIEEQRTLLEKVFTASPDLIWYTDVYGRFLTVNPRFSSIVGKPETEFVGKYYHNIMDTEDATRFMDKDSEAMTSGVAMQTNDVLVFADGHEEILDSVRTPIYDALGDLVGLLGFSRNVSVRAEIERVLRKTQMELEEAVLAANRANEHKGEFLARMSHEIRTPMNAIIGMTGIVRRKIEESFPDNPDTDVIRSNVRQIEASSQHLLGLLNDVLDISKIEAGKIELVDEIVDLEKLAGTVISIIQPRCDEKSIRFGTFFDALSPASFVCDSLRLRQVLINLLGNAVKFTPNNGEIDFYIKFLGREGDRQHIEFTIRDTGIGISEDSLANIFKSFEQGGNNISRQYGGTGLGLAISERIVQLFGGEIIVRSTLGKGSEFTFNIWLRETEPDLLDKAALQDATGMFKGYRALLVDDVPINRMIVTALLESSELEIDEAEDGVVAVKMFSDSPDHYYDIIFMDVQMPNMDGYEASVAIRGMERPDANDVFIVALTANAFNEDMEKARKHGMNAHIPKPVELEKLLEVMFRFLHPGKQKDL